jgi:hypothetical protein
MIALQKSFKVYQGAIMPGYLAVFSTGLLPTVGVVIDISDTEESEALTVVSELTTAALQSFANDPLEYQMFLTSELSVVDFPIHHVPVHQLKPLVIENGDVEKYVKLVEELNELLQGIVSLRNTFFGNL